MGWINLRRPGPRLDDIFHIYPLQREFVNWASRYFAHEDSALGMLERLGLLNPGIIECEEVASPSIDATRLFPMSLELIPGLRVNL